MARARDSESVVAFKQTAAAAEVPTSSGPSMFIDHAISATSFLRLCPRRASEGPGRLVTVTTLSHAGESRHAGGSPSPLAQNEQWPYTFSLMHRTRLKMASTEIWFNVDS